MGRDCKAMEAIDVEAIDVEAKDMNRKDKEVKDMSQVHLTPLVGSSRRGVGREGQSSSRRHGEAAAGRGRARSGGPRRVNG